ncbi:TetR/AcrR family transcriptional regulator [Mycolicibacterium wolinskyi]|uniref:TetR family transcriptional regulator n=1 Tax=Mycolicibacterium wolinskyi TaxID=59750 RepID=A0A1X2EUU4_9MYCO|nr:MULTISPECIES: TetR/AcrR family transcriptional regulator [Mycolicibacterium]MCV7287071.1 TetR/AcrR family transcriptional regulator [Mycolicibacterium wolinskyi]MCV7292564.1 TetR/AcrR family transcriptional regulator [Mycolicibacterium goodii]ORX09778.1 TetR family transcriptional regulator [Mycolicibacterium wolinskyi]
MADRRRYDSLRRLAQAKQTRAEIADAARRLFVTHGWATTTVRDVARAAEVSVPTVYAAYQNKAGLVWALVDAADLSADLPQMLHELESGATPQAHLAAMAGYDRRLFERAGDLVALIREAGRTEPDLAALYRQAREAADQTRIQVFSGWPAGTLRAGLDVQQAVDIYAALCNVDVYTTLTVERGWPPDRVEHWWTEALARELIRR